MTPYSVGNINQDVRMNILASVIFLALEYLLQSLSVWSDYTNASTYRDSLMRHSLGIVYNKKKFLKDKQ